MTDGWSPGREQGCLQSISHCHHWLGCCHSHICCYIQVILWWLGGLQHWGHFVVVRELVVPVRVAVMQVILGEKAGFLGSFCHS